MDRLLTWVGLALELVSPVDGGVAGATAGPVVEELGPQAVGGRHRQAGASALLVLFQHQLLELLLDLFVAQDLRLQLHIDLREKREGGGVVLILRLHPGGGGVEGKIYDLSPLTGKRGERERGEGRPLCVDVNVGVEESGGRVWGNPKCIARLWLPSSSVAWLARTPRCRWRRSSTGPCSG